MTREIRPIRYEPGTLWVLDQTRLPHEQLWLEVRDADGLVEAIRSLRVRGAPLLGVAAGYGLAAVTHRAAEAGIDVRGALMSAATTVRAARPTAVNLAWAVDRVVARVTGGREAGAGLAAAVLDEAVAIHDYEAGACRAIGELGASELPAGAGVLTVCNTGALATGGIGTALGVIRTAHETGRLRLALACETRPLLQGARLTAWELERLGIPFRLVTDSAAGWLMDQGLVDAVVVGADRIAVNGDTANKVGTYVLAVLARRHGIPVFVAAPSSTIDPATPDGRAIPVEQRHADEVRTFHAAAVAPEGVAVINPAFDVTPAELVTAIVTERGVLRPPYDLSSETGTRAISAPSSSR